MVPGRQRVISVWRTGPSRGRQEGVRNGGYVKRDRGFESGFLQRRICEPPVPLQDDAVRAIFASPAQLFEKNISYGFRRNLLGLRRLGVVVSLVALTGTVIAAINKTIISHQMDGTLVFGGLVALATLLFWTAVVKPSWVEAAANAYARELLAACDSLGEKIPVYRPSQVRRRMENAPRGGGG